MAVARNKYKNRATPMEAKMACEVGRGAAESGIKRSEANELAKGSLQVRQPNSGRSDG